MGAVAGAMGWILILSAAAVFGGLIFGLRDLLPYLAARRTGVLSRKGAREVRVRHDEDPAGFKRLLANRSKGAAAGFGLSMIGLIGLGLFWLAVVGVGGPLAILILFGYLSLPPLAAFCLIRGFVTGRMFVFWNFPFLDEATREQDPVGFWVCAAVNSLIVSAGAFALWTLR